MSYEFPFGLAGSVLICPFLGGVPPMNACCFTISHRQELETLKKALKEIEDLWKKGPYEAEGYELTDTVFLFQCEEKRRPMTTYGSKLQEKLNHGRICLFLKDVASAHVFRW